MKGMFIKKLFGASPAPLKKAVSLRELIRKEAQVGGTLFGPVPAGTERQFFCLDEHSWVWYESWIDPNSGQRRALTTRYEVRPTGTLKSQGERAYHYVSPEEERNLLEAIELYNRHVRERVYGQKQSSARRQNPDDYALAV